MQNLLSPIAAAFVRSINERDPGAFAALFAHDAVVEDAGRVFRGVQAIKDWSEQDIFVLHVTLDVLDTEARADGVVLTTKVDGNFDRTGLPDPVIIDQDITICDGLITELKCRLANERPKA